MLGRLHCDEYQSHTFRYSDLFAFMWFLVLTYASLSPLPEFPGVHGNDKLLHVIAYAVLVFFGIVRRKSQKGAVILIFAIITYSDYIELVQSYVNRQGEIADSIANSAGAVLGAFVITGLFKLKFFRFE